MNKVIQYYTENKNYSRITKKVFIITDEPLVINYLKKNYPDYIFISTNERDNSLNFDEERKSYKETQRLIIDLILSYESDYFVGTYSSQISRIVFNYYLI
jgi:hypothetical protein